jgi:peroxiredoxin
MEVINPSFRKESIMKRTALMLTAIGILLATVGCGSSQTAQTLEVGLASPSLELASATGGKKLTIDSLKGEVVVLNFWSTSCTVCLNEIDDLKQIHDSGKAKVIGIALDDDSERVQKLVKNRDIQYPVLLGDQATFERFDGYSIPYTLVLDQSQVVRKRFFGRMTEQDLDEVLEKLEKPN